MRLVRPAIPKVCVGARLLWQHEGAEPALMADTPVLCIIQVPICVAPPILRLPCCVPVAPCFQGAALLLTGLSYVCKVLIYGVPHASIVIGGVHPDQMQGWVALAIFKGDMC